MGLSKFTKILGIGDIFLTSLLPLKNYAQELDSLKKIPSEKFHINLNDNEQYILTRNKEEGLKEIFQLNKTQKHEEAWLYISSQDKWHEFGIESKINEVSMDLSKAKNILDKTKNKCDCLFLRNLGEEIYFIHNHPLTCKSGLSQGDLIALIKTTRMFQNYDVKGIVVTDKGSIEYYLNPNEKERLFKKNKESLINKKIKRFEKMPYSEISKFFNIKFTKLN